MGESHDDVPEFNQDEDDSSEKDYYEEPEDDEDQNNTREKSDQKKVDKKPDEKKIEVKSSKEKKTVDNRFEDKIENKKSKEKIIEKKSEEKLDNNLHKKQISKENSPNKKKYKARLKTPNSLILDIYGVMTSHDFKNQLKRYASENLTKYINENFGDKRFIRLIHRLLRDFDDLIKLYPDAPKINVNFNTVPEEELNEVKKQIEANVRFRIEKKFYGDAILFFYEDIWFDGYKRGELKAHVYDDVAATLADWRMEKFIKVYTLASGKPVGQRLFLGNTMAGNLNPLIANCLDPSNYGKEDKKCFVAISLALRSDPDKLVYLTDNVKRMQTAKEVKFQVVLVKRPDNNVEMDPELVKNAPIVNRMAEIEFLDEPGRSKECC